MLSQDSLLCLQKLPAPEDYFSGASGWFDVPPRRILLFTRRTATEIMAEGVGMHPRFVLCACLETDGILMVDGHLFPLAPGQALLLYPFQQHSFSHLAAQEVFWLFVSFELPEDQLPGVLRGTPFTLSRREFLYLDQLVEAFEAHRTGDRSRAGGIEAWLTLLLGRRMHQTELLPRDIDPNASLDPRLRRVVRHIYDHLDSSLEVADLAREANASPSHLRRVFRQAMGVSLGRFMLKARLSHAAALLHESGLSVTEIGEACGFDSVYSFSRAFRHENGEPPSSFRQRVRSDSASG